MARVLLIRQGHVPYDPRVKRALDALVSDGHEVDVICERTPGDLPREELPGIVIRRLGIPGRTGHGLSKLGHIAQYGLFMLRALLLASWLHLRRPYQLVEVHSLPDTLVFAALLPRLTGTPVVLDLQEPMPEFFASRFGVDMDHPFVRVIGWLEQMAIHFADRVLTCTEQMRAVFIERGAPAAKVTVILNAANEEVFDPSRFPPRPRQPGRFDLVCHGTIEERYGHDTVIRAMAVLRDQIPELRLRIFGDGSFRARLRELVDELGLNDRVWFSEGFVPIEQMLAGIADADVGVVAMKRDVFRDLTHCNKMFDFITMRRPQLVSRTAAVEAYFDDDCFEMFDASDLDDLARAIRRLHDCPQRCEQLVEHAARVNEAYRWPIQRESYLQVVRGLLRAGGRTPSGVARIEPRPAAETAPDSVSSGTP
ncbi:MAG TPA: glycosyltransferase family 4 protein [Candidatus Dormibacteraeota bacterium]|nr:glycosyltransferase family 4 protein [Candidatus Dormibacteraeota bacterium]